jgi:FkbM family methyltransferase
MTEITQRDGIWWPKYDVGAHGAKFQIDALDAVYPYVVDWSVAVQAGGNVGLWPKRLANRFEAVYTFEPVEENWACLVRNCTEPNVFPFRAALGLSAPPVGLTTPYAENCGAYFVDGSGQTPVLEIDQLNLTRCGLIALDIEGYERRALLGAHRTIERCRPAVLIESKEKCSTRYGEDPGQAFALLMSLNYLAVAKIHRDVVFCPAERVVKI